MRLQRRITRTEQSYKEAMAELRRLQAACQPIPIPNEPKSEPEPASEPEATPEPQAEASNLVPADPEP